MFYPYVLYPVAKPPAVCPQPNHQMLLLSDYRLHHPKSLTQ
jgi:hypothetical protein